MFAAESPLSSPSPVEKKSIKGALRKKDEPATARPVLGTAKAGKATKRKLPTEDETVGDVSSPDPPLPKPRPAKRARTASVDVATAPLADADDTEAILPPSDDLELLRPTMRARKKYRVKGRVTSPAELVAKDQPVDYDELPSPPRPSAATVKLSPPPPKNKKSTARKAIKVEKGVKIENDAREDAQEVVKGSKSKKASKKAKNVVVPEVDEKADEPVKTAKPKKAQKTTAARTKKRTQPQKDANAAMEEVSNDKAPEKKASRVAPRPRRACRAPVDDDAHTQVVPEKRASTTDQTTATSEHVASKLNTVKPVPAGQQDVAASSPDNLDGDTFFNNSTDFTVSNLRWRNGILPTFATVRRRR